jgi:Tfp pilus assembly protein PilF
MLAALLLAALPAAEVAPPPRPVPAALPVCGLAEAVHVPDLCLLHYPVASRSAECQRFCDQALGYFYSYVWMEAARSFETALLHDPDCAFAWLGLHRAMDKWGKGTTAPADPLLALAGAALKPKLPDRLAKPARDYALDRARALMDKAGHREQLLVKAKLQEKGLWKGVGPDDRRKEARATLDELLALYADDEEGWFARAVLADGQHGPAPFHKALLRVNPLHPGANHELVHFYEAIKRPALGWPYAEGYMKSSPGLPHAFHMQAHLATRVGKWGRTTEWSKRAVELEREYHRVQGVKPADDHQYSHHLEILTKSLVHDGRFAEAREVRKLAEAADYQHRADWFRLELAAGDGAAAEAVCAAAAKADKPAGAYYRAVLALDAGDPGTAAGHIEVLRQQVQKRQGGKPAELRLWEVQGRLLCQTGRPDAGLKLLKRAVDKTKDDFGHHAWGNGASLMEAWGVAALEAGRVADAEEAFQEALAHDAGSVRGALGLWAICRKAGRADEADRFLALAKKCWASADPADFARVQAGLSAKADRPAADAVAAGE